VVEVGSPALEGALKGKVVEFVTVECVLEGSQSMAGVAQAAGTDANMGGEDAETDEVCAAAGGRDLAFDRVDFEAEAGEVGFDFGACFFEEV
jgi:hypothetical protein